MQAKERVRTLQKIMREKGMDVYIIPSSDSHQSEYVADYFKSRQFISGFTGSAGTVIVSLEHGNGLWTDGRYFIQAEEEIKGSSIDLFKMGEEGVPTINQWLKKNLADGATIGFDGRLFSANYVTKMKKELKNKDFNYQINDDLIDLIWIDRPAMPAEKVIEHDLKFAGKQSRDKIKEIRELMVEEDADTYVIGSLDDIVWLCNIRGNDMQYSPVVYAYAMITMETTSLYVDLSKISDGIKNTLLGEGITVKTYDALWEDINNLDASRKVALDSNRINSALYSKVKEQCKVREIKEISALLKAKKNEIEIENLRKCNIRDNVAMVKFLYWLKSNIGKIKITELDIEDKLLELRSQMENNLGASFATIAAYGEHGALNHYKASEESQKTLEPEGFVLIDSGGQYYDGTTDITRTIVLGPITEEMRRNYTLVLRGNINLSRVIFRQGTKGCNLDALARMPLWEHGLEFKHGTGHGLGFFLNVHEGPHNISQHLVDVPLEVGMVVTNEPGYYVEGDYGIRLENDILVAPQNKTEWGQFLKFETLTYCPFDLEAIDTSLLKDEEKQWLNEYHKKTYELLAPYLNEDEKVWLKENTKEV
ncbi:aminopeptidase P family protein [Vallitalea okinawensis]|uniref:aminopeptidase P family protein n=1 Tax=Vallitalea okinawensis TaxID=2078660 RepID=UPI000CFC87BF|nr:aminopeptidase P family protein [Vallitalea okinawensis]